MVEVDPARFEALVAEALDAIPDDLARHLDNVAVFVRDHPPERGLLGRYEGIPLTSRDGGYTGVMPDRIEIYRIPICRISRSEAEVVHQVQVTVVHEIAHHFGIGDARLHELGWG